jgi:hypothetical protein
MAPRSDVHGADDFRDAIVAVHLEQVPLANVPAKFSVPTRQVRLAILDLDAINAIRIGSKQDALIEDGYQRQVFRWATKYAKARMPTDGSNHTEWELHKCILCDIKGQMKLKDAMEEFGISKATYKKYTDKVVDLLGFKSLKEVRLNYKESKLSIAKIQGALGKVPKLKPGRKPLLTADEEALIVASAEMKGAASQPVFRKQLASQLNEILDRLPSQPRAQIAGGVKYKSGLSYARSIIRRVNKNEPGTKGQKVTKTGEIKVAGLSNRRAKQSDPRLSWIMFHRICSMYRAAKKKRMQQMDLMTSSFRENVEDEILGPKSVRPQLPDNPDESGLAVVTPYKRKREEVTRDYAELSVQELTKVPPDLEDIQPRSDQVWNCDEIGFDPNGKWHRIVCTYKWSPSEKIWKTQTGERAPFWVTILFFTRADGQCFIPPTVVHQGTEGTADFLLNLPGNWIVHITPSGYMDRDGWFKTIENFTLLSGASATNEQFLYFDGHDSHWDADALALMPERHVEAFFLKAGDSENDQPNDNGPNGCMKSCYNDEKSTWDERFATTPFTPAHMNSVLAKAWAKFTTRAAPIIVRAFEKTRLCPVRPPTEHKQYAGGSMTAALQCAEGKKSVEIDIITRQALRNVDFNVRTSVDPVVIIKAQGKSDRNLLIRSVAYDVVSRSLIVPVQEMKRIVQEHSQAKSIKLGSTVLTEQTRQNPDTSSGHHVTDALRAQARAVQDAKKKKKAMDETKKKASAEKQTELAQAKLKAYTRVGDSIRKSLSLAEALRSHQPAGDLKLAYQHLGFKISNLPDGKKETFATVLGADPTLQSIPTLDEQQQQQLEE